MSISKPGVYYSIDTSAILEAYTRAYVPKVFPTLWHNNFEGLVQSKRLLAPVDVLEDLSVRDDDAHEWAKERKSMFIEIFEYESELRKIMRDYPRLVDSRTGRSGSDPMVIALAFARGYTVVSHENRRNLKSPKIPDVCDDLGITHIKLIDLFEQEGWRF